MDLENKSQNLSAGPSETGEDFGSTERTSASARPQRPRIRTTPAYSDNHDNTKEGGFRPEGFGANLQSSASNGQPGGFRPRFNNGGYQPRGSYGHSRQPGGYQPRQQGGYRPRYNNGGDSEGFQPRQQGNYQPRPQQGAFRPRYNAANDEGGFQPRQQGGYRPRPQGGYQPRQQGGYQGRPQGGYQPRQQGGYQGHQQGGYQGRSYGPNRGGFRQRSADYDPNAKYSMKKRIEYKEDHIDPNEPLRLNKFLANAGVCSRREADEFIQAGVVTVNGKVVTELGTKVLRSDEVKFHDQPVSIEKKVYVLLNKPKDYVTTVDDPQQRKTVMDLVKDACPERIYPVGRLDRNTMGVLLLTNDGELACKLTHPKFLKKKVYHVYLDKNLTAHDMQQIADGITLEDGEVHADAIEYADDNDKSQVGIEIHSGKNRIVRRIFESLGYHVTKLDRVMFAGLTKKNLRRGDWRYLTEKEVDMLRMGAFE